MTPAILVSNYLLLAICYAWFAFRSAGTHK
jgi:hypothetical protein